MVIHCVHYLISLPEAKNQHYRGSTIIITARIRSMTGRYCFHRCLSVNISGGGVSCPGLDGRGVPHPMSGREGGGVLHPRSGQGVPHPRSGRVGGLGYPPDQVWMGYPPGPGMGYPPRPGTGYPPRPGMGYPPPPSRAST